LHTQQLERDKFAHATQLERDKQTDLRTFRIREYERVRDACGQLAALVRSTLVANQLVGKDPNHASQLIFDLADKMNTGVDEILQVLAVEPGAEQVIGRLRTTSQALDAYVDALGFGDPSKRAPDDEVKRAEEAAKVSVQ